MKDYQSNKKKNSLFFLENMMLYIYVYIYDGTGIDITTESSFHQSHKIRNYFKEIRFDDQRGKCFHLGEQF